MAVADSCVLTLVAQISVSVITLMKLIERMSTDREIVLNSVPGWKLHLDHKMAIDVQPCQVLRHRLFIGWKRFGRVD